MSPASSSPRRERDLPERPTPSPRHGALPGGTHDRAHFSQGPDDKEDGACPPPGHLPGFQALDLERFKKGFDLLPRAHPERTVRMCSFKPLDPFHAPLPPLFGNSLQGERPQHRTSERPIHAVFLLLRSSTVAREHTRSCTRDMLQEMCYKEKDDNEIGSMKLIRNQPVQANMLLARPEDHNFPLDSMH